MNLALTLLTHRRVEYLEQTLRALKQCEGIDKWRVVLVMDCPDDATRSEVRLHAFFGWEIVELDLSNRDTHPYARVSRATLMALSLGFATADFVAHLEEDVVPSSTYLTWMAAMAQRYRDDSEVFTINPWSGPQTGDSLEPEHLERHMTPWGIGIHLDRFREMRAGWDFSYWDRGLNERMRGDRRGVFPALSKVRDIGERGGVNPPGEWAQRHGRVA